MSYNPDTDRGQFRILRRGNIVFAQDGSHFYINPGRPCGLPIAGTSLTKQHRHELVVQNWSGGAHCCNTLYIIALEDKPFLIQKIELEHSDVPIFRDLDGDGIPEILMEDWTFAYWKVSFAQSPAPEVVLSYNGEKWVFDPKLNLKAPLLRGVLFELKKKIVQDFERVKKDAGLGDRENTGAPVLLWDEMLTLIYSGNAALAFQMVKDVWPSENVFQKKFLHEFRSQLAQSPFFDALKRMNTSASVFFKD